MYIVFICTAGPRMDHMMELGSVDFEWQGGGAPWGLDFQFYLIEFGWGGGGSPWISNSTW